MADPSASRAALPQTFVPLAAPSRANADDLSGASRRLRALAEVSGSLSDSLTAEEAADLVEQQALAVLGASSAVVVTLSPLVSSAATSTPSGDILTLVHAIGLPADVRASLQRFPLDAPLPLAEVARTGEPIFLPSEMEL